METRIDLDAPTKGVAAIEPGSVLSELARWEPVIAQIEKAVKSAMAGGTLSVPVIKLHLFGENVDLGPTPIKISHS